jgi:hypothetical protein
MTWPTPTRRGHTGLDERLRRGDHGRTDFAREIVHGHLVDGHVLEVQAVGRYERRQRFAAFLHRAHDVSADQQARAGHAATEEFVLNRNQVGQYIHAVRTEEREHIPLEYARAQ